MSPYPSFVSRPSETGPPTRRSPARRGAFVALAAALIVPFAVLVAPSALAADGPYTIDGVIPDSGTSQLEDPEGNVKELGPLNSNTTKIGVIHADAVPDARPHEPQRPGRPAPGVARHRARHRTGHDWLYFAWERDNNTGSGFIAYEFMQDPPPAACAYDTATEAQLIADCNPWDNRKAGDFMILWDQQGGSLDLYLRIWSGTGDEPHPRRTHSAQRHRLAGCVQR